MRVYLLFVKSYIHAHSRHVFALYHLNEFIYCNNLIYYTNSIVNALELLHCLSASNISLKIVSFCIEITKRIFLKKRISSIWRRVPESNRCTRICNPLRHHSANSPSDVVHWAIPIGCMWCKMKHGLISSF